MIERIKPKPEPPKARVRADTKGKPLVRISYVPGKRAYLLAEGPQQSEIRWVHNGNTLIVCNEHIERI